MTTTLTIQNKLTVLQESVLSFIEFYQQDIDCHQMVYELWNIKDVLGHITFWHESFARNIQDLVNKIKPHPLKGKLSEVNQASVMITSEYSIESLIEKLVKAQQIIETHILNTEIDLIPYKIGSRPYSREEHLEVVIRHINRHLRDLNKAIN